MKKGSAEIVVTILVIVIGIILLMRGIPHYRIYSQRLSGEAKLRGAEWTKKISIEEAKANLENSKLKAEAEVERAKGLARANEIIADSLKGKEEYLRYLYIEKLDNTASHIIYVPTEAGLPILEANRLQK